MEPRTQVLCIATCSGTAGMENSMLAILSGLKACGTHPRLIALSPGGQTSPLFLAHSPSVQTIPYRRPWGAPSWPSIAGAIGRAPAPDAVTMLGHNMAVFAALDRISCRRRMLSVHHFHTGFRPAWQWRLIYRFAMHVFSHISFCSDFIREEAEDLYPPLRQVSVTLPSPVILPAAPTWEERLAARRALNLPASGFVIGNAGRHVASKRWDVFLRTAASIAARRCNATFVVAGDGPLHSRLQAQAGALGLENRIRWLGWRYDMSDFYRSLDLLLFNSEWDALPRTPLEAAAHLVPTVASVAHSGLKEVLRSEDQGFLIDHHDERWLAEKAIYLMDHPEHGRTIAASCRNLLAQRHDPARNAAELLKLSEPNG